jgi:hypothetical protein
MTRSSKDISGEIDETRAKLKALHEERREAIRIERGKPPHAVSRADRVAVAIPMVRSRSYDDIGQELGVTASTIRGYVETYIYQMTEDVAHRRHPTEEWSNEWHEIYLAERVRVFILMNNALPPGNRLRPTLWWLDEDVLNKAVTEIGDRAEWFEPEEGDRDRYFY